MNQISGDTASSGVKSIRRLLVLMKTLNSNNGAKVLELSRATGISRQSIYRMLATLEEFGYVRRQESDDRFYLTHLVRELADGYQEEGWVTDIATPILEQLLAEVVWPTDLATFLNDAMYLRETTRRHSPFTIDPVTVGHRMPILLSALGRAYLSYCPDLERGEILDSLCKSDSEYDQFVNRPGYVDALIETTRARGYAIRYEDYKPSNRTSSIAVPVMSGERVLAAIGITFISSAATAEDIAARHLDALKAAALAIEGQVSKIQSGS